MTETQFQTAVFNWFKTNTYTMLAYHIPNEGKRFRSCNGIKKGAPDICIPVPRGVFGAMYIELKTASGKVSQEQYTYIAALQELGNFVVICRSLDEVKLAVSQYLSEGVV